MQRIARELNLSETVFLLSAEQGGDARARIFTPLEELPFARHPVLGTAILLCRLRDLAAVRLETGSGVVPVELTGDGAAAAFGWMEQPLPTWETYEQEDALLEALERRAQVAAWTAETGIARSAPIGRASA